MNMICSCLFLCKRILKKINIHKIKHGAYTYPNASFRDQPFSNTSNFIIQLKRMIRISFNHSLYNKKCLTNLITYETIYLVKRYSNDFQ